MNKKTIWIVNKITYAGCEGYPSTEPIATYAREEDAEKAKEEFMKKDRDWKPEYEVDAIDFFE